ncbi:carboxypeptidase-like regulatory domain-containing protein [Flavobacterium sp. 17A]|uniref:Carboxypeptidase-like regulatory domain-containing protein n=1 Tax=Flavobacterium potami TaxID=2872310 RepID=A0A9X1HBT7_9FLAO|nr:MG2 domain-containing protein [Flavobacterium potami]MBZ4036464.1 carboxypeptidase-like regulatory domain-containing protein [Flavobacterium potami]
MKNILIVFLLISSVLFGQQNDKKWKQVIDLENDGKVKSANKIVTSIYKKAVRQKNEVEMIKCFFYQSKYLQAIDENAQTKIINNLKNEIDHVSIPSKAILNLVYAKCLQDFSKKEFYSIYDRTNTTYLESDFLTWSNDYLQKQIETAYTNSLQNEVTLKNTLLNNYEKIFHYSVFNEFKNKTVYDYALAENIAYYSSKIYEGQIEKSDFTSYKRELLGNSGEFIKLNLGFVKNEKLEKVLSLYQKQEASQPTIENQWERVKFCAKYLLIIDTDYISFLNNFQKKIADKNLIEKIQLEKAMTYYKLSSKKLHPDYKIKSVAILDSILASNIHSNTYKLALEQKSVIKSESLSIDLQENTYEGENTRAQIHYNNIDSLKISFFKITQKQFLELQSVEHYADIRSHNIIKNMHPILTQDYLLPSKKDYYNYSTEVLLPKLGKGTYVVYFESDSYKKNTKSNSFGFITITDIAVLSSKNKSKILFQVVNRKTGMPLENVTVKLNEETARTDKNGISYLENLPTNYRSDGFVEFSTSNDTLSIVKRTLNNVYGYYETTEKPKGNVKFYLDRAIYRPGQTVHYKGIAFQKDNNITAVAASAHFKIVIQDSKYQNFKEIDVTTNEFGSFSGEFILPKNGITGSFDIKVIPPKKQQEASKEDMLKTEDNFWNTIEFYNSYSRFRVEEYKRPKFEITFDPIKGTQQLDKEVKITGMAKAFTGSSITGAQVKYTVKCKPYVYERGEYYFKNVKIETIAEGETQTNEAGKFEINFIAKSLEYLSKKDLPIFEYLVSATVTDINGETHTSNSSVKIGYHDLVLNIIMPQYLQTKNKNEISISSTNLNGQFSAVDAELKVYFDTEISNKFKPRTFTKPEIEGISKEDFEKLFPYENNEKTITDQVGKLVYTKKIKTEKDKKIALDFISDYKSGNYTIVLTAKDSFENTIETKSKFVISQSKDKFRSSQLISLKQINENPKKDGFVLVKLHSVVPDIFVNLYGNYRSKPYFEKSIYIKNGEALVKIPLKNDFENNMNISYESYFENSHFNYQLQIPLETKEKQLEIEVETFRNKIEPGKNENWSFKLNALNTKSDAEFLASMYDSSLDMFHQTKWQNLEFYNYDYNNGTFKTNIGSAIKSCYFHILDQNYGRLELNNENNIQLMWFGFDFNDSFTAYQYREYQKQLNKKLNKPSNAKMVFGLITDESDLPIQRASVRVKGTQRAVSTDRNGYYEIEAGASEELVFSAIGYVNQNILPADKKNINVKLFSDSNEFHKVDLVGYESIKSKKISYPEETIQEDNTVYNTAGIENPLSFNSSPEYKIRGLVTKKGQEPLYIIDGDNATENDFKNISPGDVIDIAVLKDKNATAIYGSRAANGVIVVTTKKAMELTSQVKARKNLSETAFFLPNLRTDAKGKVSFNFTSPEALTAWKFRLFGHNKDAISSYLEKSVITQKELMIIPNFPRFFREKDTIVISAKISNVTAEAKTGIASLQFFDAVTMQPIDTKMLNAKNIKNFTIAPYGNTTSNWTITIPEGLQGIQYRIVAKSGNFSDGEESILPVLTNNMLVTESIPIWIRENSTKEYTFENLKNNTSTTLKNHQFTFEYTSNPTWLAIQSLPYLMEYEHECAEQTFARYYANALASEIISSNPKIATVFENWRKSGKLNSKLEDNEELKSLILAETPWFNDAQTENEKKKNLSLLFDLEKMKTSQQATFEKLKQKQRSSGGFVWFDGDYENEYITRHILAGLGHLEKLSKDSTAKIDEITKRGIPFLDNKFLEYHKERTKNIKANDKLIWLNPYSDLHYLYTRSFYLNKYPLSDTLKKVTKLYLETAKKDWLNYSIYEKGLAALTLNRFGEKDSAKKIIESLKETASNNEDWGMYWIANKSGWYWYQAPIETQALLIEAFAEITNDTKSVDAMKVWLLKNKQTKNWPTTKSTTEAIYALLMQGTDWLSVKDNTVIKLGDEKIITKKLAENEKEAETGYIKLNWKAEEIKKEMASIKIENKSKVPGFGGAYWQYFEDLDKIKNNTGAVLSVSKELFLKKSTLKGDELQKITTKDPLKTGDLVTVRLIITSKEDTEYIHLKDMRASCFEPVNVLSQYQYKDRLGYYMSTKDAATHFFFDKINKGTYVLEYDIRVNNSGEFSNGITTIQSMYAPEFASHTKGIRVKVN